MKRREFITLLGGAAVAWPLGARAQQRTMPASASVVDDSKRPLTLARDFRGSGAYCQHGRSYLVCSLDAGYRHSGRVWRRHIGLVIPTQRKRLAWHQSLPFAFLNCLAALPIRPLVPDRTFVKITMVSESWSRAHTLRAVIMTYGNSIILFTPSTPSYTAT